MKWSGKNFKLTLEGDGDRLINAGYLQLGAIAGSVDRSGGRPGMAGHTAVVDSSWNVMAHGDAREGKWRGNWRMEWIASTLHTTSEHGVSSITTADVHSSVASSWLNLRHPADLNGLVRFAEGQNLVSARVPSHFKRSLPTNGDVNPSTPN